jgi:transcriptional regulator with XRE-family HTH domain
MSNIHLIRTTVFANRDAPDGLTQRQFAELAGTTQPTLARWETGELKPNIDHLTRIRKAARKRGIRWKDAYFFDASLIGGERNGHAA